MDLPGNVRTQEEQRYGREPELCAQLHTLVDQLARLKQPALLWALVVMAERMLREGAPVRHHPWWSLCLLGGLLIV